VVEHLLCKHKAVSANPSPTQKEKVADGGTPLGRLRQEDHEV
jgi:hypothetical protein